MRERGTKRLLVLLAIVLATAGFLASCGGVDNDTKEEGSEEFSAPTQETEIVEETTASREGTQRERTQRETVANEKTSLPAATPSHAADLSSDYEVTVRVTRVIDGDTVDISPSVEGNDRVRLIGVDTPETRDPDCGVQPYGNEIKAFTTSELQGQEVGLEFDVERTDRYARLLAYVYPSDEEMFNETLLEQGYAQVATFPPNVRYVDRFLAAQEEARAAGQGLWGLSPEELAAQTDRGNGIGGGGCLAEEAAVPPKAPPPTPTPTPDVPSAPAANGGSYPPISQNSCPPNAPVKGNQSGIYHIPGGGFYDRTNPEECFATTSDAEDAGYRASKR